MTGIQFKRAALRTGFDFNVFSTHFLAAIGCVWSIGYATPALACGVDDNGTVVTSCSDFENAGLDFFLKNDADEGRADARINNNTWIEDKWSTLPMSVSSGDNEIGVKTSIGHLGTYNRRQVAKKIEEAKDLAPAGFKMPDLPPITKSNLDVWTSAHVKNDKTGAVEQSKAGLGADYKFTKEMLAGVALEHDTGNTFASASSTAATAVSTYVAYKPFTNTTLDGRMLWGEAEGFVDQDEVSAQYSAIQARMSGDYALSKFKFTPTVAVSHGTEASNTETEKSKVTIAPKVSRSFELDSGEKLEPFLSYQNETTLDDASETQKIGGGITLSEPDDYSLSLTTDVEQRDTEENANVEGRVQFKLPIK